MTRHQPMRQPMRQIARFDTSAFAVMRDFGGLEGTITWHNMSYDKRTGRGSYLMVMAPGASSRPHRHSGAEEFFVLEGELVDCDGHIYRTGDFVRLDEGTSHTSLTLGGCKLLVTHWGHTVPVGLEQLESLT